MTPLSPHRRLDSFARLRDTLAQADHPAVSAATQRAINSNAWFTAASVRCALDGLVSMLAPDALRNWAARYPLAPDPPRPVGVVMAGNLPLVGFHDLLCVLVSGHLLLAKLSSQDQVLPQLIRQLLVDDEPAWDERFQVVERLNAAAAFIATGSDNTARYFHHYFGQRPHLVRRNRVGVAVLTGQETAADLAALADDVFLYFGLGCRNVAKLYLPRGFDLMPLFEALAPRAQAVVLHNKYANNYDYQRAGMLLNQTVHHDVGGLLLREADALASPLAVLHYAFYDDADALADHLHHARDRIQVVVGSGPGRRPFGTAQCPAIDDYADGVDTMAFLGGI